MEGESSEEKETYHVKVVKLFNAGKFHVLQSDNSGGGLKYTKFIADLNNYCSIGNHRPTTVDIYKIYAVYDESAGFWLRGRVTHVMRSIRGPVIKCFLIDEGRTITVIESSIQILQEQHCLLPDQYLSCQLFNVVPITLGISPTELVAKQVTKTWDTSANDHVKVLVSDKECYIDVKNRLENGTVEVDLIVRDENFSELNVNDYLINKGFAVNAEPCLQAIPHLLTEKPDTQNIVSPKAETAEKSSSFSINAVETRDINHAFKLQTRSTMDQLKLLQLSDDDRLSAKDLETQITKTLFEGKDELTSLKLNVLDENDYGFSKRTSNSPSNHSNYSPYDNTEQLSPNQNTHRLVESRGVVFMKTPNALPSPPSLAEEGSMSSTFLSSASLIDKPESNVLPSKLVNTNLLEENVLKGIPQLDEDPHVDQPQTDIKYGKAAEASTISTKKIPIHCYVNNDFEEIIQGGGDLLYSASDLQSFLCGEPKPIIIMDDKNTTQTVRGDCVVIGDGQPKPLLDFKEFSISTQFVNLLNDLNVPQPLPLHAHLWPTLLRGRNAIGISPSNSFNMLGYLVPILMQLTSADLTALVPSGNGPIVAVILDDWREVHSVAYWFQQFLAGHKSTIRLHIGYHGAYLRSEDSVLLLNGCEIIICTPSYFHDAIDDKYTNMNRLCYLVLDKVNVLLEKFEEDVTALLDIYTQMMEMPSRHSTLSQLIAIGSEWSVKISEMVDQYFDMPIWTIVSPVEASLLQRLHYSIELDTAANRHKIVAGYLKHTAMKRIILFVNSAKHAEDLHQIFGAHMLPTRLVTGFIDDIEQQDTIETWHRSGETLLSILVATDDVNIKHRDANCVIHYDFPSSKSIFGRRVNCLMDTLINSDKDSESHQCMSIIYVTEDCSKYSPGLVQLLTRAGHRVPNTLSTMAITAKQIQEDSRRNENICQQLKCFGECLNFRRCTQRHVFLEDVDICYYKFSGVVKILILKVISANCFMGRIIDEFDKTSLNESNGKTLFDPYLYDNMIKDLNEWFSTVKNQTHNYNPTVNGVYAVKTDSGFERVSVSKILTTNKLTGKPETLEVAGIDTANNDQISVDALLSLPESIKTIPAQAMQIISCFVKPISKYEEWTEQASEFVEERVAGKILEGKVLLNFSNTIWVDPLVEKVFYHGLQVSIPVFTVSVSLLRKGFAEKNGRHIELLEELLPEGMISSRATKKIEEEDIIESLPSSLPNEKLTDGLIEEVVVSAVESPALFFVQRAINSNKLQSLDNKIDATMAVSADMPASQQEAPVCVGQLCVARFSLDKRWYRGTVLDEDETGSLDVYFIDHGDREWLSYTEVKHAWKEILSIPQQAIECRMSKLVPLGKDQDWVEEDGDKFWEVVKDRTLDIQIVSRQSSIVAGEHCFAVNLMDVSDENERVDIAHEMVSCGYATGTQEYIETLFPKANLNPQLPQEYARIPALCLQILCEKEMPAKLKLTQLLQDHIDALDAANRSSDSLYESQCISSVCHLLCIEQNEILLEMIIVAVSALSFDVERNRLLVQKAGGLRKICHLVKKQLNHNAIKSIIMALNILGADEFNQNAIRINDGISNLCSIFSNLNNPPELRYLACEAVTTICNGNTQNYTCARVCGFLNDVCMELKGCNGRNINVAVVGAIAVFAQNSRCRELISQGGCLDSLCHLAAKCEDNEVLIQTLFSIKACINNHQYNSDYLVRSGLPDSLKRIVADTNSKYGIVIKRICKDILVRLKAVETLPQLTPKRIPCGQGNYNNDVSGSKDKTCLHPKTVWSQRAKSVTIAIMLRGVVDCEKHFTRETFSFSTNSVNSKYILNLKLFKAIKAEECTLVIHGGDILVTLIKEEKETWSRLLATKEKPPYLSVDFERWKDEEWYSDKEEDPIDDNQLSLPKEIAKVKSKVKYSPAMPAKDSDDEMSDDDSDFDSEDETFRKNTQYKGHYNDYDFGI